MRLLAYVTLLALAFAPDAAAASGLVCAAPVFEIDAQGKIVRGSKVALREAALRGDPLRVGWRFTFGQGPRDFVLHWAEASFVTVFEDDVFTQVPMIHQQAPRRGKSHVILPEPTDHWNASLGSNGILVGKFSKEAKSTESRIAQLWCLSGEAAVRCQTPAWRVVYRHDRDGKPLAGSKQALLGAIRRGDPVRLAWGGAFKLPGGTVSVEHGADPVFLTIASGKEVYAQLAEHVAQRTYEQPGKAGFENPLVVWRGVLGTDGSFDAATVDRATGKSMTRLPQRAAIAWLAFAPDPSCDTRPPLNLAIEGGVTEAP